MAHGLLSGNSECRVVETIAGTEFSMADKAFSLTQATQQTCVTCFFAQRGDTILYDERAMHVSKTGEGYVGITQRFALMHNDLHIGLEKSNGQKATVSSQLESVYFECDEARSTGWHSAEKYGATNNLDEAHSTGSSEEKAVDCAVQKENCKINVAFESIFGKAGGGAWRLCRQVMKHW